MDFNAIFGRRGSLDMFESSKQYAAPRGLSAEGKKAWTAVMNTFGEYNAGYVRFQVFSLPPIWDKNVLSVASRGPLQAFFEYDSEQGHLMEAMRHALDKVGLVSVVQKGVALIFIGGDAPG
jgi:hypothetical protein